MGKKGQKDKWTKKKLKKGHIDKRTKGQKVKRTKGQKDNIFNFLHLSSASLAGACFN